MKPKVSINFIDFPPQSRAFFLDLLSPHYDFTFDDARQDDDLVIEKDGAVVLIDSMSQLYLAGAAIDFVEDVIGSSFQITNPNATSSCGCGSSFSV